MKKILLLLLISLGLNAQIGYYNNWSQSGNAVGSNTNFIGSTDNRSLLFKTNNIQRLKIDSLGQAVFTHTDINTPALSVVNGTNQIGFYMDNPIASIPLGFGSISNSNFGFFTNFGTNIAAFTTNNRFSIGKPNFSSYSLPASLLELRAQGTTNGQVFGVRNSLDNADLFKIQDNGVIGIATNTLVSGNSGTIAVLSDALFSLQFSNSFFNPADATTYYIGQFTDVSSTNALNGVVYLPYNCTLVGYSYSSRIQSVVGSAETSTMSVRINNTTDNLLSSSISYSTVSGFNNLTGTVSIDINAGDFLNVKWLTPSWVTNPTNVGTGLTLWFVRRK